MFFLQQVLLGRKKKTAERKIERESGRRGATKSAVSVWVSKRACVRVCCASARASGIAMQAEEEAVFSDRPRLRRSPQNQASDRYDDGHGFAAGGVLPCSSREAMALRLLICASVWRCAGAAGCWDVCVCVCGGV